MKKYRFFSIIVLFCSLFASSLNMTAVAQNSPNPVMQEAQSYLSDPLLVKPFLANVITPNGGTINYDYPQLLDESLNNLLHVTVKPYLTGLQGFNSGSFTNQIIQNDPSLRTAYKNAIQSLPSLILKNSILSNWLFLKQAYVSKPAFFYIPQFGNYVAMVSCQTSACRNVMVATYNLATNKLLGYVTIQENPNQTYIFGAQNQTDLSILLMINSLSNNPNIISAFYGNAVLETSTGI